MHTHTQVNRDAAVRWKPTDVRKQGYPRETLRTLSREGKMVNLNTIEQMEAAANDTVEWKRPVSALSTNTGVKRT